MPGECRKADTSTGLSDTTTTTTSPAINLNGTVVTDDNSASKDKVLMENEKNAKLGEENATFVKENGNLGHENEGFVNENGKLRQEKTKENGKVMNGNTKLEKGDPEIRKKNGDLGQENGAFVQENGNVHQETPKKGNQNGHLPTKAPKEDLEMATRKKNGPMDIGSVENGEVEEEEEKGKKEKQKGEERQGQQEKVVTNGTAALLPPPSGLRHKAEFANPAYEPEGQLIDYERANGTSGTNGTNGTNGANGTKAINVFKEQKVNNKDLPHKVTFTERRWCSCKRLLICIVVLAVLAGLAVATYFLYKHFSQKKTYIVQSRMRLVEEEYTIDLEDFRSSRYMTLSHDITVLLDKIFKNDETLQGEYNRCEIEKFESGSVWTEINVIFNKEFDAPFLEKNVKSTIQNNIKDGNMLGKFKVDKDHVETQAVYTGSPVPPRVTDASSTTSTTTTSTSPPTTTTTTTTTEPTTPSTTTTTTTTTTRPTTTTLSTTTPVPTTAAPSCQTIWIPQCQDRSQTLYNRTTFPNPLGHSSQEEASRGLAGLLRLLQTDCHPYARRLVCGVLVPQCIPGEQLTSLLPCQDLCRSVITKCTRHLPQSFIDGVDCDSLHTTECIGAPPLSPPTLRLVDGAGPFEGRLEIQHGGEWGTVCDDGFDKPDADVVCRQLGYSRGGIARQDAYFTAGQGQIWLKSVECEGSEPHLSECRHSPYSNTGCRHNEDAGVTCLTNNLEVSVETRLFGGSGRYEGRVEVYYKDRWGPVCDDHFTEAAARTVCRTLGISDLSAAHLVFNSGYPASGGEIWLDNVKCNGSERSIALCGHNSWGQHDCNMDHSEDVAISCLPPTTTTSTTTTPLPSTTQTSTPSSTIASTSMPTPAPTLEVRLVDGVDNLHGRLDVRQVGGEWGGVCDDGFGETEAQVVCRMLGYMDLDVRSFSDLAGSSRLWLDEVTCSGIERTLAECTHRPWGDHDCSASSEAVAVSCGPEPTLPPTHPPPPPSTTTMPILDATARVENGPDSLHGLVVVTYGSQSGTVCDDSFDEKEAKVICRMLGYHGTDITYDQALYGPGADDLLIILDDLECIGNETTLAACSHNGWGENNCGHNEDVGISCGALPSTTAPTTPAPSSTTPSPTTTPAPGDQLRLVGGMDTAEGALQLLIRGMWTPVCARNLTEMDAITVCRTLGYNESSPEVVMSSLFERQNMTLGVTCDNVTSCLGGDFVTTQCGHDTMTAISCVPQRIRLVTAGTPGAGRPEVFYKGQWGNICDDAFDDNDAKVVCHMLGYNGSARVFLEPPPSAESSPTHLDDLACIGNETSIFHCMHHGLGLSDCSSSEAVGIKCTSIPTVPTELQIRLADGPHPLEGRLEVFRNGSWGTVCETDFQQTEAQVVCRMLNASGTARVLPWHETYSGGRGPIWLRDVSCSGREMSLADCDHAPWGDHGSCYHTTDISISCGLPPSGSTTSIPTSTAAVPTTTPTIPPVPVRTRLIGKMMGRVEVFYNNTWGTVCKDGINDRVARVICHSLGFNDTTQSEVIDNTFPAANTSMPIHLDSVRCRGNETNLGLCEHDRWGQHNCVHQEDVAVQCAPPDESVVMFRLAGGSGPWEGRLEVLYDGQWGSVCDDGFSDRSAQVACRQLGYSLSEAQQLSGNRFGAGPSMMWLSHVICDGDETNLLNCSRDQWGSHSCQPSEAVSIQCQTSGTTLPPQSTSIGSQVLPGEMLCEEIMVDECKDILPYKYTALPNKLGHQTQEDVKSLLSTTQWHHLFGECSSPHLAAFVCSLLLPGCLHIQDLVARRDPCKSLCKKAEETCRPQFGDDFTWPPEWDCTELPENDPSAFMDDICFEGQTQVAGQCEPIHVPFCNHDLPYNRTQLPNTFGHQNQQKIQVATEVWLGVSDMTCHPKLRSLVCALYTPRCPQFPGLPLTSPCSTTCHEVRDACQPHLPIQWPSELNCLTLPNPDIGQTCDTIQLPESTSKPTTLEGVANTTMEASTATSPMETTQSQQATTPTTQETTTPVIIVNVTTSSAMTNAIPINTTTASGVAVSNTSTTTSIPPVIGNTTEFQVNFTGTYTPSNVSTSSTLVPINVTATPTNATATSDNTTTIPGITSTMSINVSTPLANTTVIPTTTSEVAVNVTIAPQNTTVFYGNTTTQSTTIPVLSMNVTTVTSENATAANVTTSMKPDNVTSPFESTTPMSTIPESIINTTSTISVLPTNATTVTSENNTVVNITTSMKPDNVTTLAESTTPMSTKLESMGVNTTVLPGNTSLSSTNVTEAQTSTTPTTVSGGVPLNATIMPLNGTTSYINATMLPVNTTMTTTNVTTSSIKTTTTYQNTTTSYANTPTLSAETTMTSTNVTTTSIESTTISPNTTVSTNGTTADATIPISTTVVSVNATVSPTTVGTTNATTVFVNTTVAMVNHTTLPLTTTETPSGTNITVVMGNTTATVIPSTVISENTTVTQTTTSPMESLSMTGGLMNVTSSEKAVNVTATTGVPQNTSTTSAIEAITNATTVAVAQKTTESMVRSTTTEPVTKVPPTGENVTEAATKPPTGVPIVNTTQQIENVTQTVSPSVVSTTESVTIMPTTSSTGENVTTSGMTTSSVKTSVTPVNTSLSYETTVKPDNTTSTTIPSITVAVNETLSTYPDRMLTTNATVPLSTSIPTAMSPPSTLGDVTPVNVSVSGAPTAQSSTPGAMGNTTMSPTPSTSSMTPTVSPSVSSSRSGFSSASPGTSTSSGSLGETETMSTTSGLNISVSSPSPTGTSTEMGNVSSTASVSTVRPSPAMNVSTTSVVSPEVIATNQSASTTEASSVLQPNTTTESASTSRPTTVSDERSTLSVSSTSPGVANLSASTVEQPKSTSPTVGNISVSTTEEQSKNASTVSVSDVASSTTPSTTTTNVTTEQSVTPAVANLTIKSEASTATASPSSSTTISPTDVPIVVPGLNTTASTISTVQNMTTQVSSEPAQPTSQSTLPTIVPSTASINSTTEQSTTLPSTITSTESTQMSSTPETTTPKVSLSTSGIIKPEGNVTSTPSVSSTVANQTLLTVTETTVQISKVPNTTTTATSSITSSPSTTTGITSSTSVSTSTPTPDTPSTTLSHSTETTIGSSTSGSTLTAVSTGSVVNTTLPVVSETTTVQSTVSSTTDKSTTSTGEIVKTVPSIPASAENSTVSLSSTTTMSSTPVTTEASTAAPSAKPNATSTTLASTESPVSTTTVTTLPSTESTTTVELPTPSTVSSTTPLMTSTTVQPSSSPTPEPSSTMANTTVQVPPTMQPPGSTTAAETSTPPVASSTMASTTIQMTSTTQPPNSSTAAVTSTPPVPSSTVTTLPVNSTTVPLTRFIITSTIVPKTEAPSTVTTEQTAANKTEEPTPPTLPPSTTVEPTPIPVIPEAITEPTTSPTSTIPTTTTTTTATTETPSTTTVQAAEPSSSSTPLSTASSTTTQPSTTTSETTASTVPSTVPSLSTTRQSTSTPTTTTVISESPSTTQSQPTSTAPTTSTLSSSSTQSTTTAVAQNSSTVMPLTAESTTTMIRQAPAVPTNNNQTSNGTVVSQPASPSTTAGGTCSDISGSVCASQVNYTRTGLPNFFNHTSKSEAESAYAPFEALTMVNCSALFQRFTCSLYLPPCDGDGNVRLPCRGLCETVKSDCGPLLAQFNMEMWPPTCNILPVDKCYDGTTS